MQCFLWNGEAMVPQRPKDADRAYVIGQRYWLDEVSERSWASHNHQFAWLQQAWENLPEDLARLYPTPEHLRKRALIQAGFYNESVIDVGDNRTARAMAKFAKAEDEFAAIIIRGPLVIVRKAKSQRTRGPGRMNRVEFQRSKDGVLAVVADMIGVKPEQLRGAA